MAAEGKTVVIRDNSPVSLAEDVYLAPYQGELRARAERACELEKRLTGGKQSLVDFASAHEFFGLHRTTDGWVFREYAPHAVKIVLKGDFTKWRELPKFHLKPLENGVWELRLPARTLRGGDHYLIHVFWNGGDGDRVPAYSREVVQDENTQLFSAVVPCGKPYVFRYPSPPRPEATLIYESHVGMAQEEEKVGSFNEYREKILPRVVASGYNTLQLMAIMGHPYYGSFGYHVANFFSVSTRFGTPNDFKRLVDEAHHCGLRVIIDLVHSHAVKNEAEGIARIDGSRDTYFREGPEGEHPGWNSLLFDYGKTETLHFLLSNCRYWLDEFHLDGFRFDGVTSMLYYHHGLGKAFTGYADYFGADVNLDALTYLTLANKVIHTVRSDAVTIAEDVSGMPALAAPEGVGFDIRLAMGVSDMWFKLFDVPDDNWNMFYLYNELTNRRRDEKSLSYVECHDQAIVGGQTAMFTLAGASMYWSMNLESRDPMIDRAIALHKLSRLATAATGGHGYLNFMGNEFGHPEWIDFPREGNNWSLHYARRLWALGDADYLRYHFLKDFDRAIIKLVKTSGFYRRQPQIARVDDQKKVLIFERDGFWFCFNFHPTQSYTDYAFEAFDGEYVTVLDSDSAEFGGFSLRQPNQRYFAQNVDGVRSIRCYLPSRTALVLHRQ